MATIRERAGKNGVTKYTVEVRLKGYPPQTATFERKTDARIWIQQTESAIREGRHFKTSEARKHTLADAIDRYKRDKLPHRNSDIQKVGAHLDWWKSQLGAYYLSDITPVILAEYRDKLSNSKKKSGALRSPATVNRFIASLSITLSTAMEWGWINENPLSRVKKMKEPRGRVRFLSDKEREDLLRECRTSRSPHLYHVVVLALSTGCRWSEMLHLRWKDMDLTPTKPTIRLDKTKNGERRSVPLTGHALDLILKKSLDGHNQKDYVFPGNEGKTPADIRDAWNLAVERAQLDDFHFHDLRHTAASYLAMNGATPLEIAEILGHKTLAMVKRYAHLTEQHTRGILERMNEQQFA